MPTTITAIANQKGGVGKTTTTINLAAGLASIGQRVLLIDMDPQANATSGLGLDKTNENSVYSVLVDEVPIEDVIQETSHDFLHVVSSELDLAGAEVEISRTDDYLFCLRNAIQDLKDAGTYDSILIDCPPTLGVITLNALAAADDLLIPLQCEYFALEGLSVITNLIGTLNESANPNLVLNGIVFTMFDGRTNLARQVVAEVQKHFPDGIYETLIPRTVRLSEAPSFGQSIFQYDGKSNAAEAYLATAHEYLQRKNRRQSKVEGEDEPATP